MATETRPNVLVILTDDQGYGDISANGNRILKTPHWDKPRSESVRFTNFYVSPTCAPTRSALITGRHEFRNGLTHTIMESEPEVVKRLSASYEPWWTSVQPHLVNESAVGPAVNPNKEQFWKLFGGGPTDREKAKMDPARESEPKRQKSRPGKTNPFSSQRLVPVGEITAIPVLEIAVPYRHFQNNRGFEAS